MRHRRRPTDSVSELSEGPVARTEPARMPEPQPAPAGGAAMVPVNAMLSPGDPPSVFVQFSSPDQVRGAIHGEAPRPRCLLQGVGELSSGDRVAAAFQLPTMAFVQIAGRVLAVDGDRATLELSSNNPQDIASLLAARR